jgi:CheY-like chemotaxis protein
MPSILVVEDHFDTRTVLEAVLSSWGYAVQSASTGAEALEALSKSPFDVILCDIGLPDQTGWEVMKKVRKVDKKIRAVALTSYSSPVDRELSRAAGFNFHLAKPPDTDRLQSVISTSGYSHYRVESRL